MDHKNGITVDVYSFPECSPITAAKQWKCNRQQKWHSQGSTEGGYLMEVLLYLSSTACLGQCLAMPDTQRMPRKIQVEMQYAGVRKSIPQLNYLIVFLLRSHWQKLHPRWKWWQNCHWATHTSSCLNICCQRPLTCLFVSYVLKVDMSEICKKVNLLFPFFFLISSNCTSRR